MFNYIIYLQWHPIIFFSWETVIVGVAEQNIQVNKDLNGMKQQED